MKKILGGLFLIMLLASGTAFAEDRKATIDQRIREIVLESAYIRERARSLEYEARDLTNEKAAIVAEEDKNKAADDAKKKEVKKDEKKSK
jgi:hypothetical protein